MAYPVRLRHPRGVSTISVEGSMTLDDLKKLVLGQSEIPPSEQELKFGYPPKLFPPGLDGASPISSVPITRGEQIVVNRDESAGGFLGSAARVASAGPSAGTGSAANLASSSGSVSTAPTIHSAASVPKVAPRLSPVIPAAKTISQPDAPAQQTPATKPSLDEDAAFAAALQASEYESSSTPTPTSASSRAPQAKSATSGTKEEETVDLPNGGGIMQHRIVPDDNSCLFSSIAIVFLGGSLGDGAVKGLRGIVANAIRKNPFDYSEVILGRPREEYISTILKPNSWGGAIELSIFSKHFNTEIDSFDVQSGRADKFGEGEYDSRCLLVYSGIHYDAITTSPIASAPPEFHTSVFPVTDPSILPTASKLVAKLKEKRYFTDVANFDLRCGVCKMGLKGEKGAREHAIATGHVEFGEY